MDSVREVSGTAPMWSALDSLNNSLREQLELRLNEGNLPTTTREQRKILTYRINNLLTYIGSNITDGIDGFSDVQTPINELITDVMSVMRSRRTRKANQEAVAE